MSDYNFETLNSRDFEHLVRDLLNAQFKSKQQNIVFRSFPTGKDRGIDLLDAASSEKNYKRVVQVKHVVNTPYSVFLSQLIRSSKQHRSEIEKIKKLNPERYIIATSKSLTLANKEEIMRHMSPYIHSLADIIDREELNNLLTLFPEVELNHTKLWFSSVAVFQRILHNDVHGRSMQLAAEIQQKLKLYVPVYSFDKAISILKESKFLVLIGEPGCGKTTFAEMVLYKLAGLDFSAYWIDKSVSEVEALLKDDNSKQVFYFDDFLGHTRHEIENCKAEEKGLLHFLRRLTRMTNKYFILTTRTSLINSAAAESERFRASGIFTKKQEINVFHITEREKITMIENHLAVFEVPVDYINTLIQENRMVAIAKHKNFSPRLIEFVTHSENYSQVDAENYFRYIMLHLNNPHEVWLHAYEQQLDDYDRFLLTTLYSFGSATEQDILECAFEERLKYEINTNNISRRNNSFKNSFKKLLGSLITFKRFYKGDRLDFINPSLEDFLNYYLSDNNYEKLRIVHGALYVEQIYSRFRTSGETHLVLYPDNYFWELIQTKPLDTSLELVGDFRKSYISLYSSFICWMFFKNKATIVAVTTKLLRKVNWDKVQRVGFFHLFAFLKISLSIESFKKIIAANFENAIFRLIDCCPGIEHLEGIKVLFEDYDQDYIAFIGKSKNYKRVKSYIDHYFQDDIFFTIEDLYENAKTVESVGEERENLVHIIQEQYDAMCIDEPAFIGTFDEQKWESICANNIFKEEMSADDGLTDQISIDN